MCTISIFLGKLKQKEPVMVFDPTLPHFCSSSTHIPLFSLYNKPVTGRSVPPRNKSVPWWLGWYYELLNPDKLIVRAQIEDETKGYRVGYVSDDECAVLYERLVHVPLFAMNCPSDASCIFALQSDKDIEIPLRILKRCRSTVLDGQRIDTLF